MDPRAEAAVGPNPRTKYQNYYQLFEVDPSTSQEELSNVVQERYLPLMRKWHPDAYEKNYLSEVTNLQEHEKNLTPEQKEKPKNLYRSKYYTRDELLANYTKEECVAFSKVLSGAKTTLKDSKDRKQYDREQAKAPAHTQPEYKQPHKTHSRPHSVHEIIHRAIKVDDFQLIKSYLPKLNHAFVTKSFEVGNTVTTLIETAQLNYRQNVLDLFYAHCSLKVIDTNALAAWCFQCRQGKNEWLRLAKSLEERYLSKANINQSNIEALERPYSIILKPFIASGITIDELGPPRPSEYAVSILPDLIAHFFSPLDELSKQYQTVFRDGKGDFKTEILDWLFQLLRFDPLPIHFLELLSNKCGEEFNKKVWLKLADEYEANYIKDLTHRSYSALLSSLFSVVDQSTDYVAATLPIFWERLLNPNKALQTAYDRVARGNPLHCTIGAIACPVFSKHPAVLSKILEKRENPYVLTDREITMALDQQGLSIVSKESKENKLSLCHVPGVLLRWDQNAHYLNNLVVETFLFRSINNFCTSNENQPKHELRLMIDLYDQDIPRSAAQVFAVLVCCYTYQKDQLPQVVDDLASGRYIKLDEVPQVKEMLVKLKQKLASKHNEEKQPAASAQDERTIWMTKLQTREIPYQLTADEVSRAPVPEVVLEFPEFLLGYFQFDSNKTFIDQHVFKLIDRVKQFSAEYKGDNVLILRAITEYFTKNPTEKAFFDKTSQSAGGDLIVLAVLRLGLKDSYSSQQLAQWIARVQKTSGAEQLKPETRQLLQQISTQYNSKYEYRK